MTSSSNQRSSRIRRPAHRPVSWICRWAGTCSPFPCAARAASTSPASSSSPSPTLYRRALGWRQKGGAGFALGVLGASFGGASFVTGAALLPTGLAKDNHGLTLAGGITLGVGALLTAAGIWAIANNPLMEQAGAGAQYGLPEGDGSR